jgi:hypothetical protein
MATLCAAADWRSRRARLLARSVPTLGEVLAAHAKTLYVLSPNPTTVSGVTWAAVNRYLPPRASKTAAGCTGAAAELAKPAETAGLHPLLRWMDKVLSR